MTIPLGPNEAARLAALRALDIVDSEQSENFTRICEIAQFCFGVPIVTITFVEANRLWFKAHAGLSADFMARDNAFSNFTILQDGAFVVSDTLRDPRFADNPLVRSDPKIRFYAGAPIALTPGLRVGSLCLVDQKPLGFSARQATILEKLAQVVVGELRLLMATRAYLKSQRSSP